MANPKDQLKQRGIGTVLAGGAVQPSKGPIGLARDVPNMYGGVSLGNMLSSAREAMGGGYAGKSGPAAGLYGGVGDLAANWAGKQVAGRLAPPKQAPAAGLGVVNNLVAPNAGLVEGQSPVDPGGVPL